jgi:hypothetical protein
MRGEKVEGCLMTEVITPCGGAACDLLPRASGTAEVGSIFTNDIPQDFYKDFDKKEIFESPKIQ